MAPRLSEELKTALREKGWSDKEFTPFSEDEQQSIMAEYMETIGEMAKLGVSQNSPRLEALDIAKRITHDEAGETVVSLLGALKPDHATARRFFTLLVTLLYDTTRLGHPSDKPTRR